MATALGPRRNKMKPARWARELGWRHVVGVAALVFALFPVWFVVIAAFSDSASLSNQRLWPETFTLRQLRTLLDSYPFWSWFRNSLVISIVTSACTVLLAAAAAFAFSRLRFRGRRTGLLSLLLVQMFPASLAFVAIYLMVRNLPNAFPGLGNGSTATIILFYLGGALGSNAWLIKGFFDTIPKELDESARIDGASHAQVFWRIILPLALPVLAIIFLLAFISAQAEFLVASVVLFGQDLSSPSKTVATGLQGLLAGDRYDLRWGPFAIGALIASIPVVLLFQFLQRFIVGGITAGAVKG
ncbi:sugar ABC transporter permease [Desertimonas flava]|uniref:sugar ABC transporter permease n=1 Tax=Desertimonas flava TaxID=2064846 RepID=UPI000E34C30F|nr:ABC transporter permease subunit [Desertimonas flava]